MSLKMADFSFTAKTEGLL